MEKATTRAVRMLPVLFLLHGVEEVWVMPGWAADRAGELPSFVVSFMPTDRAVLIAALAALFVPFLVGGLLSLSPRDEGTSGESSREPGWRAVFVALLVAALGTNALGHLGQALLTGGYVPGLVSGLVLCVPYAGWTLREFMREDLLSTRGVTGAVLASAVLQVPVLIGLLALLRRVMG